MESFLQTYGYMAILVGTFLEGETILVLAGLIAHQGYLHLGGVIFAAFIGSLCGDQLFFYLGRRHSAFLIRRKPAWQTQLQRVNRLIARFQTPLILGFRFLYGLRTVTPFAIGMGSVSMLRFFLLNAVGAGIWAVTFGGGGYLFGKAIQGLMGNVRRYEPLLFGLVAAIGACVWAVYLYRRRRGAGNRRDPRDREPR